MNKTANQLFQEANTFGLILALSRYGNNIDITIPVKNAIYSKRITDLQLSMRSSNGLMRAGIDTVEKLNNIIMSDDGLERTRNIGKKSVSEIKTLMLSLAYNELNEQERLKFWQDFIDENGI